MKLIDKDAVLAKIDKRIKVLQKHPMENHKTICHLDSVKQSVNSLEVKEVNLDKEYEEYVEEDPVYNKLVNGIVGKNIAKHFFELGLKAQKL